MLDLKPGVIVSLPVDELGLLILSDLLATEEWNEHNYLQKAREVFKGDALEAIAEALGWLRARAFIARTPGQSSDSAIFVTRTGRRVAEEGKQTFHVLERLQVGLHPTIDGKVRRQFLLGEYEQGVFVAMKAVEIRVRRLGRFPDDLVGVDLMTKAFRPGGGPLVDTDSPKAEREGTMALFRGAYAVLRNPAGHREVNYDDPTEAAEAVATASMLMRILDRVERRIAGTT